MSEIPAEERPRLANRVQVKLGTTGTAVEVKLGEPMTSFQDFDRGGIVDGDSVRYVIEDGHNWEIGEGIYVADPDPALFREPLETSLAGNGPITLTEDAYLFIAATAFEFPIPKPEPPVLEPPEPVAEEPPTLTGETMIGSALIVSPGSWTGYPEPSFSYQWLSDGQPIEGEGGNAHVLDNDDMGHMISCVITATNSLGEATVTTEAVGPIAGAGFFWGPPEWI